ncbi:MAG: BMP family ABC transporter substrate-binding protein [Spirochaeta sp.]|nr:BMP family ABC transporter substrate-binding protein [Spirochaeta sp.]
MRKILLALMSATLVAGLLLSCGAAAEQYEIAMITDAGDIDDESFNQGTWEGIVEYAEENDLSHRYYRPSEISDSAYISAIDLAVRGGAEIVVTPGFLFEQAIFSAQDTHPDVNFVLIDGAPHGGDYNVQVADNTVSVFFAEEESGFLAGYAAVNDGFESLGYMGGMAVPAVVRFGVGYVAGSHYAADELDKEISFADNRYVYLGDFAPSDTHKSQAESWYNAGTDVIFAAAGGAGSSVMAAAEDQDAWMIGVDVDQSANSDRVLTSAMKDLAQSVQQMLDAHYQGEFPGGETLNLTATEDGVGLPMESARFRSFSESEYNEVFEMVAGGDIEVPSNYSELQEFFAEHDLGDLVFAEGTIQP